MNIHDMQALRAIQRHYEQYKKYPKQVEATPDYISRISQDHFLRIEADSQSTVTMGSAGPYLPEDAKQTRIPVVLARPCDTIVYRTLFVEKRSKMSLKEAEARAEEALHQAKAKLPKGLLILEDIQTVRSVICSRGYFLYFCQMTAYVFGEKPMLDATFSN